LALILNQAHSRVPITYSVLEIFQIPNLEKYDLIQIRKAKKFYKNFIEMGWYRAHRSFNQEPEIIDNCLFCGSHKKIKRTDFTIVFSEHEYNTGNICVDCYSANARKVYLG
jgi:hypothetical protein